VIDRTLSKAAPAFLAVLALSTPIPFLAGPGFADGRTYEYVQYQCFPYTAYSQVTHGNKTYYRPYIAVYCLRYTYTLTTDAYPPAAASALKVSPLPSETPQYTYSVYPNYGYYNPYGYPNTGQYGYPNGSPYGNQYGYPGGNPYATPYYPSTPSYTTVTLTAEQIVNKDSGARYVFASWIIDGSELAGSNVQSVTMDRSHSALARYRTQYFLKVSVDPPVANVQGEGWYDSEKAVNLSLPPVVQVEGQGKRYVLGGWDLDGASYTGQSISVQMAAPHSVRGIYRTQYYLKVGSDYGQVRGEGWYDENSTVTLTASPELPVEGFWGALGAKRIFYQWSGDLGGASPILVVKMDGARTVRALYSLDQTIPIAIILAMILGASVLTILFLLRARIIEL